MVDGVLLASRGSDQLNESSQSLLNSSTNGSFGQQEDLHEVSSELKIVIDYLLLAILIVVMLAMGCEITWSELLCHMKRPIGILIGMVSQFIILPISAYSLMQTVTISGLHATGVLIISCCPGGVLSNVFAYFCEGDLSLSVAMTTFSTLLALGMMPLNVWIYGRNLETDDLVIPYDKLALSLVAITSPVFVGMILRWKSARTANIISKAGSYAGIAIVIICIILEVIVFPNMFTDIPSSTYAIVLALPFIGLSLGYLLSFFFRQNPKIRKTIAIECGIQNVPTALTIISLSFPVEVQEDIILLPWLYGFSMMCGCTCVCISYRFYKKCTTGGDQNKEVAITEQKLENGMVQPENEINKKIPESLLSR